MNITDLFAEVATRLGEITKLNVFPYYAKKVPVPGACVGPVETIDYDQTYGRGLDKVTFPVLVLVGDVSAESSARQLQAYVAGSGDRSIKAMLEAEGWESCDELTVRDAAVATYTSAGVTLVGAEFTVEAYGQGVTS